MLAELSPLEKLQANAELVISAAQKELGGKLEYNQESVEWLDGFICRQCQNGNPNNFNGLVNTLGSFLGECIIRSFGGAWAQIDGIWAVSFDESNAAFPFGKVLKQLEGGGGDSVLGFFKAIPLIFKLGSKRT